VANHGRLKARPACQAVATDIPFVFNQHHFQNAYLNLKVRPGAARSRGLGGQLALSAVSVAFLVAATWFGGKLTYHRGMRVAALPCSGRGTTTISRPASRRVTRTRDCRDNTHVHRFGGPTVGQVPGRGRHRA
jgi:hypothetical protein